MTGTAGSARTDKRPNILLIQTDQHRFDGFGAAGNPVLRTPALDRLAREGTVGERMYVSSPLCAPSRASLFTGKNLRNHGVWTNGVALDEAEQTLAGCLKAGGYRTGAVGKLHLTPYDMAPLTGAGPAGLAESALFWERNRVRFTRPYYGLDTVDLVIGHNKPAGHYGDWLAARHPESLRLFGPDAAVYPPSGAMQSWKSGLPVEWHSSTWIGRTAADHLRKFADQSDPFFLWVSFPDPHHPFCPPGEYAWMYDPNAVPLPRSRPGEFADKPPHFAAAWAGGVMHDGAYPEDVPAAQSTDDLREIIAHTYGMISLIDDNVDALLALLDELDIADTTVVVFTSDHGELLGEHGLLLKGPFMYECLIRVPFIVRYPGVVPAGGRLHQLASQVDVLPTLLDLAGLPTPPGRDGRSLAGLLRGDRDAPARTHVLVEYRSGYDPGLHMKTIVSRDRKLTVYIGGIGELYDLRDDPDEYANLIDDSRYAADRVELTGRLLDELLRSEPIRYTKVCHA